MIGCIIWLYPQWTEEDSDQNDDNNNISYNHLLYLLCARLPAYYTKHLLFPLCV